MRVLLVEDDRMIGEAVQVALRDASYAVDWAHDGSAALIATQTASYDLMLLDLGLPRVDGLEVLRQLRQQGNLLPVLIVTARDAVDDRIRGLDLGADDYVVKPFEMGELLARMRALIRRQAGNATPTMTNGTLSLDPSTREVTVEGIVTRLSAREFSLMHALLLRPGAILSRQELENRLYGWNEEVESNAVEFLIHSIRKKLGATSIKNVRGLGWMVSKQN
ncbi:response regulator transcription factor [Glaciimonas sp. CA11.2]|uniref:response regulator transcription factor n=1 Tax=unclassified Glaciimonas TaxID=2644401 RepID=UPI002AB44969|nr:MULTISPECIES: response regulator transcription factor [unclassified Glaciimonas]MDY7545867.1 response regulator transcription factor [Glaciimonas sp. CA11.2]MEB0011490.1 response regulator transcription factor [Glaciimonas sp. Cout2]MEB0081494.1 response regulator transcription factor [Glaciimonas sp. Gout2]MEB0162781.1 response regulator transcription factor [Glaciimonas sp. CA11.2]